MSYVSVGDPLCRCGRNVVACGRVAATAASRRVRFLRLNAYARSLIGSWGGRTLVSGGRRAVVCGGERDVDGVDGLVGGVAEQEAVDLRGGREGRVPHRLGRDRERDL